jgi:hypothetical protein
MNNIDKRGKLQERPFTFRETKGGKVFIHWHGKQITILKDKAAIKFTESVSKMNQEEAQLLMARVTGHFKHGNER